ncbi:uncharacterized protein LOC129583117 [Paramacrobiotus metropolitanus]|uniref:uncharacterized protein LOC129583117 n=1 Tax=Paramacrobiotus metropolitanus TaxID=2943436 RepID=UPI002445A518|nr:uncharacterized protein LOC129583117 [Paramacrobiotus metropolitanus]
MQARYLIPAFLVAFGLVLACSARFGYRFPARGIRRLPGGKPNLGRAAPGGFLVPDGKRSAGSKVMNKLVFDRFKAKDLKKINKKSATGVERLWDFGKGAARNALRVAAGAAIAGGVAGAVVGEQADPEINIVKTDPHGSTFTSVRYLAVNTSEAMKGVVKPPDPVGGPNITVNVSAYALAGTFAGLITIMCTGVVCMKCRRQKKDISNQKEKP